MTILILCNIGARDVFFQNRQITPPRSQGETLLKNFEKIHHDLSLPIIGPVLDELLPKSSPETDIKLYCFGTDQQDEKFRKTDTLYFAELAVRKLRLIYAESDYSFLSKTISDINPSLYDEAIDAFQSVFVEISKPDYTQVFVILAGGTPAFNMALLLQGIRFFGDRIQVVYQAPDSKPLFLRVDQQIKQSFNESTAIELVRKRDYANAAPFLERIQVGEGLTYLNQYVARRLNFDFAAANAALQQALRFGDVGLRDFVNNYLRKGLAQGVDPAVPDTDRLLFLIQELAWNAEITYLQCRYADFLGRVFRFQEASLRYLVEKIFGFPTDSHLPETGEIWIKRVESDPALHDYLDNQIIDHHKLDWKNISRLSLRALLDFALNNNPADRSASTCLDKDSDRKFYSGVYTRVNQLDQWVALRHRTIIGHDFTGVSAEAIQQNAPLKHSDNPVESLLEIARMLLDKTLNCTLENPYKLVTNFLIGKIKKG